MYCLHVSVVIIGSSTKRQRKSSKSKSPVAGDNADSDDDTFAALLEATSTSRYGWYCDA